MVKRNRKSFFVQFVPQENVKTIASDDCLRGGGPAKRISQRIRSEADFGYDIRVAKRKILQGRKSQHDRMLKETGACIKLRLKEACLPGWEGRSNIFTLRVSHVSRPCTKVILSCTIYLKDANSRRSSCKLEPLLTAWYRKRHEATAQPSPDAEKTGPKSGAREFDLPARAYPLAASVVWSWDSRSAHAYLFGLG